MSSLPSYAARVAAAQTGGAGPKKGEAGPQEGARAPAAAKALLQPMVNSRFLRFQPSDASESPGGAAGAPGALAMEKMKQSWSGAPLKSPAVVVVSSQMRPLSVGAGSRAGSQTPVPRIQPPQEAQGGTPSRAQSQPPQPQPHLSPGHLSPPGTSAAVLPATAVRAMSPRGLPQTAPNYSPRLSVSASPSGRMLTPGLLLPGPGSPSPPMEGMHRAREGSVGPRSGMASPQVVLAPRFLETSPASSGGSHSVALGGAPSELLQLLEKERKERTAEVAELRRCLEAQQAALSEVTKENLPATVKTLTDLVQESQRQQELQAGALRDGLMQIHEQRAAVARLLEGWSGSATNIQGKAQSPQFRDPTCEAGAATCTDSGGESSQQGPDESARPGLCSLPASWVQQNSKWVKCPGSECEASIEALSERLAREISDVLKTTEKHRQELAKAIEAGRQESAREVAEVRAACTKSCAAGPSQGAADVWKLHSKLAEELVALARRGEEERTELARAIEKERIVRQGETAALRSGLRTVAPGASSPGWPQEASPKATDSPCDRAVPPGAVAVRSPVPASPLEPHMVPRGPPDVKLVSPQEHRSPLVDKASPPSATNSVDTAYSDKPKMFSMDALMEFANQAKPPVLFPHHGSPPPSDELGGDLLERLERSAAKDAS